MLTEFQQKKLSYLFRIYDYNKNGYLQLEDFTNIAEKLCDKLEYKAGSKHHDGLIVKTVKLFHTLLNAIPHPDNQIIHEKDWIQFFDENVVNQENETILDEYVELIIGFLFDLFDENNDGYISFEEYKDIFMVYGLNDQYAEKGFYNLDLNKDNRLSKYELVRAIEDFLTSNDATTKGNWIFGNWDN